MLGSYSEDLIAHYQSIGDLVSEVDPIIRTTGGPALDSGRRSFSTPGGDRLPRVFDYLDLDAACRNRSNQRNVFDYCMFRLPKRIP